MGCSRGSKYCISCHAGCYQLAGLHFGARRLCERQTCSTKKQVAWQKVQIQEERKEEGKERKKEGKERKRREGNRGRGDVNQERGRERRAGKGRAGRGAVRGRAREDVGGAGGEESKNNSDHKMISTYNLPKNKMDYMIGFKHTPNLLFYTFKSVSSLRFFITF